VFSVSFLQAKKIDYIVLKNITGTKWTLTEEKKAGGIFGKANKAPAKQDITFTTGSILFDSDDQHYQCNYTLKKKVEFWMYCTEPDQYIYKVRALTRYKLVMDMYVKTKAGKYVKKKRVTYKSVR
jgi:hypothetical protein